MNCSTTKLNQTDALVATGITKLLCMVKFVYISITTNASDKQTLPCSLYLGFCEDDD